MTSQSGTRRSFLGAAAAALLTRPSPAATSTGPFDVAIIGAGAAGISAAYALRKANKSFIILEARDRVAGRAFSDNNSIPGVPVDLGAEWFIQADPIPGTNRTANPLYDLAAPRAKELGIAPDNYPRTFFDLNSPAPPPNKRLVPALLEASLLQAAVAAYGALAESDPTIPDISIDDVAKLTGLDSSVWYQFAASPLVNEHGATLDKLSVLDLWLLLKHGPTVGGYLIQSGLGNFVKSLADGLPIQLNTPVSSIQWQRAGGVQLQTPVGAVQAKTVIVTVPIGLLAAGKPAFDPVLPPQYTDAFAKLPMGVVEKVWLSYSSDIFGDLPDNTVGEQLLGTSPGYQVRWFGSNVVAVIVGGPLAEGAARRGRAGQIDFACQAVAAVFGSSVQNQFQSAAVSGWTLDPYSQGAYSYALPGGVPARAVLGDMDMARSALARQIFFAGEATAMDNHSGLPGAWMSGERAAAAAIASL